MNHVLSGQGLRALRAWIQQNNGGNQDVPPNLINRYVDIVWRRGRYPYFMKNSINKACKLFVRARARIGGTPDLAVKYAEVFDVKEVILRGVRAVEAEGRSGASNWLPNTDTGR